MNKPQPTPARQRLQQLLAIPDRQRTDEQWDELNELEIMLAPGNRIGAPDPNLRRNGPPGQGPVQGQGKPGIPGQNRKPGKRFHKRPPKPNMP